MARLTVKRFNFDRATGKAFVEFDDGQQIEFNDFREELRNLDDNDLDRRQLFLRAAKIARRTDPDIRNFEGEIEIRPMLRVVRNNVTTNHFLD